MLRKIGNLLNNNATLHKIIVESNQLVELDRIFKTIIDPVLAEHCQLAKVENNRLIVIVDKPAWAAKFREAIPELVKDLRVQPEFKKIMGIIYRVA